MSFARYPLYRDAGVDWLGDLPAHWSTPPLTARYEILLGKMLDEKRITGTHAMPYLRNQDVQWDAINAADLPTMDIAPDEEPRYTVQPGDLLVCEGGEVGRAAIWYGALAPCAFQKALHRLRPWTNDECVRFALYCFRSAFDRGVFIAGANPNTIPHLTGEMLRRYRFPKPPVAEQERIAVFLDKETAKLDALVAEQQRLIALLREKQGAVIALAVTRGPDLDAATQQSGIQWMGQLPAHWTVLPLGRVTIEKCDGPFGSGLKSEHYVDAGVRVVRLQNIRAGAFDDTDAAFIDKRYFENELSRHEVRGGDILIAGLGDERNTVGRACVAPPSIEPAMVKADCFRFRLDPTRADAEFVAAQLSAGAANDAGNLATGSTRSRISLSEMASRRVALPPLAEQRTIISEIVRWTAKTEALIASAERAIALLQERRASLISAAVTGQIDVRTRAPAEALAA